MMFNLKADKQEYKYLYFLNRFHLFGFFIFDSINNKYISYKLKQYNIVEF